MAMVSRADDPIPPSDPVPERSVEQLLDFGIVVIDKPSGPTSHQVSAYVQQILHIRKSGHSGTLDPQVTGVLPVALGRATRTLGCLLSAGKEYVALMHLHAPVKESSVKKVFHTFTGTITQLPPVRSSVKRQSRQRKVYAMEILEFHGQDVLFRADVQAGTYIRKLIHDMGQRLGCGAHMAELRRTRAGPFFERQAIPLHDLADAFYYWKQGNDKAIRRFILPGEDCVSQLPKLWVHDGAVDAVCHGSPLAMPGIERFEDTIMAGDTIALMSLKGELIGLARAEQDASHFKEEHGIAAKSSAVLMPVGTYERCVPKVKAAAPEK
ncbi:RNA-guided pseudouridylation complex pseudouridine synthase subunit Cbf5 [Candidatus Woesearchaeota archaeon CG_4_10_14_0_2_um_filter_57_5]|nr:MAG: tRNA pseudouridine(55) synthase TruB [Candidatus Woesearchaeota archaeon CG1_02_57_44]PIZ55705.1 MAG: RNA-guided pseudouridylation complex pseudouridine synthase subunit Cbf5 [Candidatus Woesearchaeota archaeon CG_4_10_14_0_2_um_filter_57_5]